MKALLQHAIFKWKYKFVKDKTIIAFRIKLKTWKVNFKLLNYFSLEPLSFIRTSNSYKVLSVAHHQWNAAFSANC